MLRSLLAVLLLCMVRSGDARAQCTALKPDAPVADLVLFLRRSAETPPSERDAACIELALDQLNFRSSADAVPVLIAYLDFERPLTEAEREGFSFHGGRRNIAGMYPATGALMMAGKAADSELVSAIKTSESAVVQRNATYTVMQIFRKEPTSGIELLKHEASNASGSAETSLRNAVKNAVQWCDEKYRRQCESLASE